MSKRKAEESVAADDYVPNSILGTALAPLRTRKVALRRIV